MKKSLTVLGITAVAVILTITWVVYFAEKADEEIIVTNFKECVDTGNPVMESYPRQCTAGGQTFVEDVGNELEKANLIRLDSPRPNEVIASPLTISGEARGYWYFEATFPVVLVDWDGRIIGEHYAQAEGEWMTEDFVPFIADIRVPQSYIGPATLLLQKDNPSGLPSHDASISFPITIEY